MKFHLYGSEDYKIREALIKWREERHLTPEMQKAGYKGNIAEELSEYYRATTIEEKIDALCDIMVFSINCITDEFGVDYNEYYNLAVVSYDKENLSEGSFLRALWRTAGECNTTEHIGSVAKGVLSICIDLITFLGYDYVGCMQETIKEISSRTGHYDHNIQKFVKDTSDEAKAKWYKADYTKHIRRYNYEIKSI